MLWDILSSRGIIVGLMFFVLIVSGSLLYSWHVRRTTEAELAQTNQSLQQLKEKNEVPAEIATHTVDTDTPGFVNTPEENTNTPTSDETEALPNETETLDFDDAFLPDGFVSGEIPAEDVLVSAYGFGPYPELPPEFPKDYWDGISKKQELIVRVWMKLMEQGIDVKGGTMQKGLVYPSIPGTIYVEWDEVGTERYIARITGDTNTVRRIRNVHDSAAHPLPRLTADDIPAGITVLTYPDGGIDPYQFLDFKKE